MDFRKYRKKFSHQFDSDGIIVTFQGSPAIYFTNLQKMYEYELYKWDDLTKDSFKTNEYGQIEIDESIEKTPGKEMFEDFLISLSILSSKTFQEYFLKNGPIARNQDGNLTPNRVPLAISMDATAADGISYYEARYKVLKENIIELQISRNKIRPNELPMGLVSSRDFNKKCSQFID